MIQFWMNGDSYIRKLFQYVVIGLTGLFVIASCGLKGKKSNTQNDAIVWSIGKADGLSIEFMAGQQNEMEYVVGEDEAASDFPSRHFGSQEPGGEVKKNPYSIVFDLDEKPVDGYRLVMNLIYNTASPEKIEISVNGNQGIFPVRHNTKKDLNGGQANTMLLAKQQLMVPVEASWLKEENNKITITPLGVGVMSYDALIFEKQQSPNRLPESPHLKPTVFYKETNGNIMEVTELEIPFKESFISGKANIKIGESQINTTFESNGYDFGLLTHKIKIPEFKGTKEASIEVQLDGEKIQTTEEIEPAKKWTFYITPRVHNDIGYTDLQPHVNELDNRNTDRILDVLDKYPFYVFNFETSWLIDNYLESRTQKYRERFYDHATEGRAPINAFYLNLLTGLSSGEELYRATYFSHQLHKERGTSFDWASLTDAPSHSWFLPTLLNDIGVKGFVVGSNQTRAPILRFSDLNEYSPFYWEGMNGEKIMMWYARSYLQLSRLTGGWQGQAQFEKMEVSVPQFLTRYQRDDYAPDAVMIYGSYVDNALIPKDADAPLIKRWNEDYAYPKLQTTSDSEFYDYIDKNFKNELPTYRGGAGAYWEDGAGSTAKATTLIQHAQETLPMAETAAGLSSMLMPKYKYKSDKFSEAWKNVMFYNEHTWGAYNSISQPDREFVSRQWEIKESYAEKADLSARTLFTRSLNRLSQLFKVSGSTHFTYNWQPWSRSSPIELELDSGQYLVSLEDGEAVEYDVIYEKNGFKKIRFIAKDIPAMGYKGYEIRSLESPPAAAHQRDTLSGNVMENSHYRLTVDTETGGIESLYDKSAGKELVDAAASYSLNEYLYVSGGEDTKILNHGMGIPPADLTEHKPASAKFVEHVETPIGQRLVVETQSKKTPTIRSEYRLYNDLKRVDITNTVEKEPTLEKEGVYFAFPFDAGNPGFSYQIQNGWLRPNKDQLPGAAREWFTTQNLVHVTDGDYSIAWASPDAPLFTLTDINRGKWPTHLDIDNGHVFSYVMNNYWFTNYKASQGGTFTFNYSIKSGNDMSSNDLAHFDADIRKPVIGYSLMSSWSASVEAEDRPLSPVKGSFMNIEDSNLQFVTLKQAEDGEGYILRFRETSGKKGETNISSPLIEIRKAYLTNGVEENKQELNHGTNFVVAPYKPNSYTTIRLEMKPNI